MSPQRRGTRAEAAVVRAAMRWYRNLKPLAWSKAEQDSAPTCNTTTDAEKMLARACAAVSKSKTK